MNKKMILVSGLALAAVLAVSATPVVASVKPVPPMPPIVKPATLVPPPVPFDPTGACHPPADCVIADPRPAPPPIACRWPADCDPAIPPIVKPTAPALPIPLPLQPKKGPCPPPTTCVIATPERATSPVR